jgi:hypothetical protein
MTVIIPSMTGELEASPRPVETAADDPVRRLVAAWLLGFQSAATRRNSGCFRTWPGQFPGGVQLIPAINDPLRAYLPGVVPRTRVKWRLRCD